jgi:hypothetical protein
LRRAIRQLVAVSPAHLANMPARQVLRRALMDLNLLTPTAGAPPPRRGAATRSSIQRRQLSARAREPAQVTNPKPSITPPSILPHAAVDSRAGAWAGTAR